MPGCWAASLPALLCSAHTPQHPRLVAQPTHPLPSAPLLPAAVLADSPHRLPSGSGRHVSGPPSRREAPAARQTGTRAARICAAAAGRQPRPPFPPDTTNLNPAPTVPEPTGGRRSQAGTGTKPRPPHGHGVAPRRPYDTQGRRVPRRRAGPALYIRPPLTLQTTLAHSPCLSRSFGPSPLLPASSSFLPPPHFVVPSHRPSAPRDTPPYTHTQFVCTWRARRFWRLMPHNR